MQIVYRGTEWYTLCCSAAAQTHTQKENIPYFQEDKPLAFEYMIGFANNKHSITTKKVLISLVSKSFLNISSIAQSHTLVDFLF